MGGEADEAAGVESCDTLIALLFVKPLRHVLMDGRAVGTTILVDSILLKM